MELIFVLALLYPVFVAALHIPMLAAYFVLKRYQLLKPWQCALTSAAIFGLGHAAATALLLQGGPGVLMPLIGVALGAVCGLLWWYILIKRIGIDAPSSRGVSAA